MANDLLVDIFGYFSHEADGHGFDLCRLERGKRAQDLVGTAGWLAFIVPPFH